MEIVLILVFIALGIFVMIFLSFQKKVDDLSALLSKNQSFSQESMQKQFSDSQRIITELSVKLGNMESTNRQVLDFTKQLKSLEDILKNPKQRGILGEYMLEHLLGNVLSPGQFQMQFHFDDGLIVDAVIFFNDKIIPIDAKFSLEKYNLMLEEKDTNAQNQREKELRNDVKKRIDETSKYLKPEEGTTEFAFMFIPAEGVYYSLLDYKSGSGKNSARDLIEYAFSKKVIIVSPTSFFAYLETVTHGLKALKLQESVKEIRQNIEKLGKHIKAYDTYMDKLGKQITTTQNTYQLASKEFQKIDKDIYKITGEEEEN
jgi:DNA recombination protein RmuC